VRNFRIAFDYTRTAQLFHRLDGASYWRGLRQELADSVEGIVKKDEAVRRDTCHPNASGEYGSD